MTGTFFVSGLSGEPPVAVGSWNDLILFFCTDERLDILRELVDMHSAASDPPFSPDASSVLLTSSDEHVLHHGKQALREAGFSIVVCRNGVDVLAQFAAAPPTLLVIDEQLDQLDGRSVIHRLYADPRFRRSPFLFLTHTPGEWPMWATTRNIFGAVCFLIVPFRETELCRMVARCVHAIHDGEFPPLEKDFPLNGAV